MKRKKRNIHYILPITLFVSALVVFLIVRFISDPHHRYLIWGIDVSAHTGEIDWERVKEQNVDFAFVKASEGATHKDKSFRNNVQRAKEAGIPVGAYHFFNFNRNGKAQARNFLSSINGMEFDLPPVVDVEEWGNVVRRPRKQIIGDLVDFVQAVEQATGQKVLIYTNKDTYRWYISETFPENDVWICSFDHTPEIEKPWTFWQYHHEGRLKGVQGKVDFNVFYGSSIDWKNYLNDKKR